MAEVRRRRPEAPGGEPAEDNNGCVAPQEEEEERGGSIGDEGGQEEPSRIQTSHHQKPASASFLQHSLRTFFGCSAAVACGMLYAGYSSGYHDRKFWFSTRQESEQEISFQGGSGLYYHYYKRMSAAPTFHRGFYDSSVDNRTVSGQTFNAVERFFSYPELITSFIYRITESQDWVEPVYFYSGTVFGSQALCVTASFVCSWAMSGTCVAGMSAVSWFVINRQDATKVDQGVPSRENWASPYFSCQVAASTGFLTNNLGSASEMFCYSTMSATTFTFSSLWEHGHYVSFVQGLCLFSSDSSDSVPHRKTADINKVYSSSSFSAYLFQFQNSSSLSSPSLSLSIGSVSARYFQRKMKMGPSVARMMKSLSHFHSVFTSAITFSYSIKKLLPVASGDFTFKFSEVKFGSNTTTDFVTNYSSCQDGSRGAGQGSYSRSTQTSVSPFFVLVFIVCSSSASQTAFRRLSGQPISSSLRSQDGPIGEQPAVLYHLLHTSSFGLSTSSFDGVKYSWTPYVCVFTAFGVCSPDLWMTVFKWLRSKSIHPVVSSSISSTAVPTIIGFSSWREFYPRVSAESADSQEFYDPDTSESITWIRSQVPAAAVFAGSPSSSGTIKSCSGSVVTSLPVYSDVGSSRRTEDTYQVYAMRSAENVYKRSAAQKTNYVVVEESICNDVHPRKGCRVKDSLDVSNRHVVQDGSQSFSSSKPGRFCQEIKMNYSPYTNYFTRVFWNRSYHVYKVNSVISFQY